MICLRSIICRNHSKNSQVIENPDLIMKFLFKIFEDKFISLCYFRELRFRV